MIAESKQRKYDARKEREETLEMTDQLDDGFMEVMKLFESGDVLNRKYMFWIVEWVAGSQDCRRMEIEWVMGI